MKKAGHRRAQARKIGRNPWLASLLAFAIFLSFSVAPSANLAMAMDESAMSASASSSMDHDMSGMATPCCDDCEKDAKSPCANSALCMSACGKLPIQIGVWMDTFTLVQADMPAPAESTAHNGQFLPPPKRPPKLA